MKLLHKLPLIALLLPGIAYAQPAVVNQLPNAGTTGTTVGALMKQTSGNAVILATTDTSAIGVVVSETAGGTSAVTTGSANYASVGQVNCLFASAPTMDHFVQISTANAGYCLDTGSTSYPTSGLVVGQVIGTTAGPIASTYPIRLIMAQPGGGGGGGLTIGGAVSGGTNNSSLYTSSAGTLQNSESLPFGVTTAQVTLTAASNIFTPILSGASSSNSFKLVLGATNTIANGTSPLAGQDFTIEVDQPASGGPYTTSWGSGYTWVAGSAPSLNQAASAATLITCHVTSTSVPTYQCYGPVASVANSASIAAPTAPSSTTAFLMQGFSGTDYSCSACSFTPKTGGTVWIDFQSTLTATSGVVDVGVQCQISVGTGTAPTKNTALAGTQIGTVMTYTLGSSATAGDVHQPFPQTAIVTGLTVGTTYWVDDACESVTTASAMALTNVNISIWEK